jgi:hypothetical protein
LARARIYQGIFGSAPFQSLYQPTAGWLAYLYQTPEWYALLGVLALLSAFAPWLFLVPVGALVLRVVQVVRASAGAQLHPGLSPLQRWKRRALVAVLHLLQPLARAWGRLRGGLGPFRLVGMPAAERATSAEVPLQPGDAVRRRVTLAYWGEAGQEKDAFLKRLMEKLQAARCVTAPNSGWEAWDLRIRHGLLAGATVLTAVEDHGGRKRLLRLRARLETPGWLVACLLILAALGIVGAWQLFDGAAVWWALILPLVIGLWAGWQRARLAARLRSTAAQVAAESDMWEMS